MSSDFTFEKPDEKQYHQALLAYLKKKGEDDLYRLLRKAKCSISASSDFSRRRWNAMYTKIFFQIPLDDFEELDNSFGRHLTTICDLVMPKNIGFDVMNVEFTPMIVNTKDEQNLETDLDEIKTSLKQTQTHFSLPADLMDKGREMAEVYLYLYVVENSIRLFIERIASNKYGPDFFNKLAIPSDVRRGLEIRKREEAKNQWIRIRGDSPLFYLDFKELGTLILNNWDLFKSYFPQQSWISTKIDELSNCRNLVAHNSFIGKHECDVIRVNFNSIIRQIGSAFNHS